MSLRRLPVYLIIDCSESMAGKPFDEVQSGISELIRQLLRDPSAVETAWISVITFGRTAQVQVPLVEITAFKMPKLTLGVGTSMGAALDLLQKQVKSEMRVNSKDSNGDWKPLCFLLTDGEPTDDWMIKADQFKRSFTGKIANVIAVTCGADVKVATLKRITDTVLNMTDTGEGTFKAFFKWISASIKTTSSKISSEPGEAVHLPVLPSGMEVALKEGPTNPTSWLFLQARCSSTGGFFLLRYKRVINNKELGREGPGNPSYTCTAVHPLEDFDFGSIKDSALSAVDAKQLGGGLPCPYCGNTAWGKCPCGRILCARPEGGRHKCPWCEATSDYTLSAFKVNRSHG
jgi:uncharacterized protein YegL